MPNVDTTLQFYAQGTYWYEDSEGNDTEYDTEFIPDWRVDNDPRLVADYAAVTLTSRYMDRANDEYEFDYTATVYFHRKGEKAPLYTPKPEKEIERNLLHGYDLTHTADGDKQVWCWYCNTTFSYREFTLLTPQAYESEANQRAFCYAMLEHYDEHRSAGHLPYIKYQGRAITRPDGSIAAQKPDFVGRPPKVMR